MHSRGIHSFYTWTAILKVIIIISKIYSYTIFIFKNMLYKNIEAEISKILRICKVLTRGRDLRIHLRVLKKWKMHEKLISTGRNNAFFFYI